MEVQGDGHPVFPVLEEIQAIGPENKLQEQDIVQLQSQEEQQPALYPKRERKTMIASARGRFLFYVKHGDSSFSRT
jgi:hypothetical protein